MEKTPVELIRIPREEQVFDREAVLGRDAKSVFPTELKHGLSQDKLKEVLGSKQFITESELAAIKSSGATGADVGAVAPDKPLVEVLAENKAKKEAEFQATWRQMKTGKNRPLDQEEVEFLDTIQRQEAERMWRAQEEDSEQLEAFRQAVAASAEKPADSTDLPQRPTTSGVKRAQDSREVGPLTAAPAKRAIRAVVRAKPKAAAAVKQASKRAKAEVGGGGASLASLLGAYGSDSEPE